MMRKLLIVVMMTISLCFIAPLVHAASATGDLFAACENSNVQSSSVCKDKNTIENPVVKIFRTATNILALLAGVVAVIMIIVSGLTMVTSGGNADQVTASRRRIVAALVGLVIIAAAWSIIRLITDKVL